MRYLITLALIIVCAALSAQVGMNMNTPEGSVSMSVTGMPTGAPNNQNTIDQIVMKLEKLEKEVHIKLNNLDRKKAERLMGEVYDLLSQLDNDGAGSTGGAAASSASASSSSSSSSSSTSSGTANININISGMEEPKPVPHHEEPAHIDPPEHHEPMSPKAMPDADFNRLITQIKAESFSDNKMRVIRTAAKNYNFSCAQIVRVIECFDFSADKITSLGITYPKVTDPKNNYTILDSFTYSSDKEDAEDIMDK